MTTRRNVQKPRDAPGEDVVLCMARCPDPDCSAPAEVYAEVVHESTDGPVPHARTLCLNRHFYLLPVAYIPGMPPRLSPAGRQTPGRSERTNLAARMLRFHVTVKWDGCPASGNGNG